MALVSLPREEEPQISVPLVDIHVMAQRLKAGDAVRLATEPLEFLVRGINDVGHVCSATRDDAAMATARFEVGTRSQDALLRVHDKIRASMVTIPVGIPGPLIVGRGIDDVAVPTQTRSSETLTANDLARTLHTEVAKTEKAGLTYRLDDAQDAIRLAPDPDRLAPCGVTLPQLAGKVAQANRTLNTGNLRDQGQIVDLVAGEVLAAPAAVANLLLTARGGRPVSVSGVATVAAVENTSRHIVSHLARAGSGPAGGPAVTLAIAKRAGANAVVLAEEALHRVHAREPRLIPDGPEIGITRDCGETAKDRAGELLFPLGLATVSIILLVLFTIAGAKAWWRPSSPRAAAPSASGTGPDIARR